MDFVVNNWSELALAVISLLGTVSALTDSTKDDKFVDVLSRIVNAIVFGRTKKRLGKK
jgi:hypothetical protein